MAKKIIAACQNGDLESVKNLVEQQHLKPDECDDEYGKTLLHWASHYGHLEVMKYLVENCKCDPMCRDRTWKNTPLHWAVRFANLEAVEYLIHQCNCDVMCRNNRNNTPLHDAAMGGKVEVVHTLISKKNCDPGVLGRRGRTPLHYACEMGNIAVVKYLLKCSEDVGPSCKDEAGNTPLHLAASNGSLSVVQHLIEETNIKIIRSEMECRNSEGETPLHEAIKGGRSDIMKYLINKGCDPMRRGKFGRTALYYACQYGRLDELKYLIEVNKLAIDSPCDNSGASPLHIAAVNGRLDTVKLLVGTFMCKLDVLDSNGQTPLELALDKHEEEIVSYLQGLDENSGIDESLIGHHLSNKELLALTDILQEDVTDSLQQIGLDFGSEQTTIEEVQGLLHSLGQHEVASSLRQRLDLALENQSHYEVYQHALKEEVAIPLKYLKVLFFGPPRTGKTSMRRRLVGEIQNLAKEPVQGSTGTAEHYDVIVKLFEDKIISSTTVLTEPKWSTVKALFGKEKSTYETDLDDELRLLYRFTFEADSMTGKKSLVPKPVIEENSQDRASKEQSSAIIHTDNVTDTTVVPKTIVPDTSTLQEVSSIEEPAYELSAEQKKQINKAFEAFNKILRTGGQEQLVVLLDGIILMNMVDTGGQPAFLEMLPALTMGPALYLIFFRLNQELKKRYQIQYVSKDREEISLGDSSYTVEEVIFQALSSIACFSCTAPKKANMPNPSHAAMLIGTHKDLLGSDPEAEIKAKDDALQESLREIFETGLSESEQIFLHHASDDQLMFAIDNMTGDEQELTYVCERLEDIIKQEFDNFLIPASWLMFNIFLRRMGNRTMSLLQCYEIGKKLEMRDTDEALWFLDHCVGIVMHFPDVEEIKDIVICDPQVVFDSVTDLILNSFNLKRVSKFACEKFNEAGQFRFQDIQKIAKNSKSDSLPLPKLVKLLEYLNIIAPIKPSFSVLSPNPELSSQPDTYQEEKLVYFMPAVLKHATDKELHVERSPTDPVPLMIHFKCGFVPVGVFCAMIASLVAQQDTLGWILQEPRDGHNLYKNKVTFRINGAFNITLISKPKQYEIHIARISTTDRALEEICIHVLKTVCKILDQIITKMKYKRLISSLSDQSLYELGFKCPKHPCDDHLVINRPKGGVESQPSWSAKSLWLNHLAIERKSTMICLKEQAFIDLRDTSFSPSFAHQSLVWFGEATEISSALPDMLPAKDTSHDVQSHGLKGDQGLKLDEKNVVDVLHEAKFADGDWENLGQQLIECHALRTIRANRHGNSSLCMGDTISQWINDDLEASWEKLAEAVRKVVGYGEATAHIVREKAGIAHTESPTVEYVEKPVTGKRKQSGGEEQVTSAAAIHTPSLEATDGGKLFPSNESTTSSNREYLCGFEVFAETSFVVPDSHSCSFEWQRYGLKLHIPEGAVPTEHTGCRVDIKAGFTGQFKIPDELHLVSCVYWLSCSQKFVKPVTLEIEHCASLQDSSQSSSLRFVAAKCSQAELPYQFKVLEKGTFESKSSYGSVQVSQFSFFGIGIFKIFQSLQRYCSTVYYIQKQVNKWDVDFVVAPNLQASLTAIQERYSSLNATSGAGFEVQFEDEAISLAIPDDGVCLPNGWAIKPLVSPIISKQQVAVFKPGQLIPCCRLRVKLNNNENPVELEHKVDLLGTKGPQKFFTITCSPQEYVVEKSARLTGEKRKQSEDKQHEVAKKIHLSSESPTVEYVEKPVTATTGKRKQSGGEEQGVPKKRRSSNVTSPAATHTPSLAATDDGMPFPSNESTTSSNRDLEMQKGAETLGIKNLRDITSYLNPLNKTAIINLGIVLGLNYNRLNTMMDSQTFLNEMLAGWLQRVDQVLQTGVPTWKRLVEALKDPRVGQNGLASKIEQEQASQLM